MIQFGLSLVARLSHSDDLDRAIHDFEAQNKPQWVKSGVVWNSYDRSQRHATVFSLVRSQTRPLSLDWLPQEFSDLLTQLNTWVASSVPTQMTFKGVVCDSPKGIISVYAPETPAKLSTLFGLWKNRIDAILADRRPEWNLTNDKGENLFEVKYPAYRVFSTIGHMLPADGAIDASTWSHVTVKIVNLHIISYAGRTLDDICAEVVLPCESQSIPQSLNLK
jgi:hypothetical protein